MGLVLFKHFITGIVVPSRSWHTVWIWPQVGQNYSMAGKTLEGMLARADQNRRMAPRHQSHPLLSTTGVIKLLFFSSRSIWNPRDFCCGVISPNDMLMRNQLFHSVGGCSWAVQGADLEWFGYSPEFKLSSMIENWGAWPHGIWQCLSWLNHWMGMSTSLAFTFAKKSSSPLTTFNCPKPEVSFIAAWTPATSQDEHQGFLEGSPKSSILNHLNMIFHEINLNKHK